MPELSRFLRVISKLSVQKIEIFQLCLFNPGVGGTVEVGGGGWAPSLLNKQQTFQKEEKMEKGTKEKEGEERKRTRNNLRQKKSSSSSSENSESD